MYGTMNDTILILWIEQDMYFFDIQTGIRYPDVITIPGTQIGYDNITNTFWYYCRDQNKHSLKSFKIYGFTGTAESLKKKKAANLETKLKREKIREIFQDFNESQQVVESDMALFVKSLGKDHGSNVEIQQPRMNQSIAESCQLIAYILNEG